VYAALEEGFGLPALEALACGAPVVTTAGSVMDELTDGAPWLAPAGDVDALADRLAEILDPASGPERARRRALGLEVASRYTWDATAAAHEDVYAEVAGRPPRRR
jgi:glycosyltransferase involved in cell wall biosynthesis